MTNIIILFRLCVNCMYVMKKHLFLILGTFVFSGIVNSAEKTILKAGFPSVDKIKNASENQLLLSVGVFDPLTEKLSFSESKVAEKVSGNYSIVQFHDGKADSRWLIKKGVKVLSYLPNNAFIVANSKELQSIEGDKYIRWLGAYQSNFKIPPHLWEKNLKPQLDYELVVSVFENYPNVKLEVLIRKFLPNAELLRKTESNEVFLKIQNRYILQSIQSLAQIDEVRFVDIVKPMKFANTEAVSAIQANADSGGRPADDDYIPINTPIWDKGLFGTGQIIGVADSGLDSDEDWFVHYNNGTSITHQVTSAESTNPPTLGTLYPNRKVIGYFVMPGALAYDESGHGTHVTGSVAADRLDSISNGPAGRISSPSSSGYDNDDGMAPNAQILFQDIGGEDEDDEGALTGQGSYPMWQQAYNAGARIHSNSYGADGDGAYTISDLYLDRHLREYEDMLILFAAGNDGVASNTIGSPGNSKNAMTVGALGHGNASVVATFSSRGPTDDGRIKPDIATTGSSVESAQNDSENTTSISPAARTTKSGTSMATPIAAGASALLRQYFTDGFYPSGQKNSADSHIPTGPLMKATLINGAGTSGGHFNKNVGWGRVNLSNSIMFNDSSKQLRVWEVENDNGLKTNETYEFKLGVKSDKEFSVTLAWYDVAATSGGGKTLVNNLDLEVQLGNTKYKGNNFSDVAQSSSDGSFDTINTVEQVKLKNPAEGVYTITVKGADIPGNGDSNSFRQGFALVATGHFDNINANPGSLTSASGLNAEMIGNNGVEISWNGGSNADYFEVYRVEGTCSTADFSKARYAGRSESNSFTDFRTHGGSSYAYKVRPSQHKQLGSLSNSCAEVLSAQACDTPPTFNQSSVEIVDNVGNMCHAELHWNSATSNCSSSPNIKYNIYRSEDPNFIPSAENLLKTVTSTSFDDIFAPDIPVFYIVRAEDNSSSGNGPNGGNESSGSVKVLGKAVGNGFVDSDGNLLEDVDNISIMNLITPWQIVSNRSADGELSYKTGEPDSGYPANTCGEIVTNTIPLSGIANPSIEYKARFNLEENWDGVVVEISTDNGQTWSDLPPDGGYPGDFSETTTNPVNACGYPSTHGAFSGSNTYFQPFSHDLSAYSGQDVKIRWRLSTDPGVQMEGFYIDSIKYPNVQVPNSCTVNTNKIQPGYYYDRTHSGHGFVIENINRSDLYFTIFYTYGEDGNSEWYTSLTTLNNGILNNNMDNDTLLRTNYIRSSVPGTYGSFVIDESIGTNILNMDFNASVVNSAPCNDGVTRKANNAIVTWQLGDETGQWCLEPIIAETYYPSIDFGGLWWAGSSDSGWGVSLAFRNDVIVATIFYYDEDGKPRWVQGQQSNFVIGEPITIEMIEYKGYARYEQPITLVGSSAGNLSLTLYDNSGSDNDGKLSVDIRYQAGNDSISWERIDIPYKLESLPHQ